MNAHLILVPGLRTLTAGRLPGRDAQRLGGEADRALDVERLGARALNQLLADLLERGDLARGEGDADLVDFLPLKSVQVSKHVVANDYAVPDPRRNPSQASGTTLWQCSRRRGCQSRPEQRGSVR